MGWRAGMGAVALFVIAAVAGAVQLSRVGVHQGYAPTQPIAFSHKLHAGDSQIPCLYCHFAARTSRHAGIPPLNVCMNCHAMLASQTTEIEKLKEFVQRGRPVEWVKVHNLPDFAYFNHARHVAVARVACRDCHGAVEEMTRIEQRAPLTMGWCLDCHRARRSDPHTPAANLDCGKCHY